MLTDYHVHLRQDERENTAEEAFTAANAERYVEVAAERGVEMLGVSEHVYRFRQALDVWQHPCWRSKRPGWSRPEMYRQRMCREQKAVCSDPMRSRTRPELVSPRSLYCQND